MIKLFSLKQQKKDGTDTTARAGQKKATAAQLRITKGGDCDNHFLFMLFIVRYGCFPNV